MVGLVLTLGTLRKTFLKLYGSAQISNIPFLWRKMNVENCIFAKTLSWISKLVLVFYSKTNEEKNVVGDLQINSN